MIRDARTSSDSVAAPVRKIRVSYFLKLMMAMATSRNGLDRFQVAG